MKTLTVGEIVIGAEQLVFIAGPCVIESRDLVLRTAETIQAIADELNVPIIFKSSYLKDNRSSLSSPAGPGMQEGLKILAEVRQQCGLAVTTDIHSAEEAKVAATVVDLLQVPAFLCRQTSLLVAAAQTGVPVNVKKGQFISPAEMVHVIKKLEEANAAGILLTERGTFFGYNRLVNDFVGLADLLELGRPVCFDATHSTQLPGLGPQSGGRPERAPTLARAAVVTGVHALFIETHPDCENALCDAATMLPLQQLRPLLRQLRDLHDFMRQSMD
ncbi:3-deoxy-8-phosphooctulonate synthase [candidate division KSB1 bacterium]|nr:3-deoxy-8-phosphooctulonate synthase [candidate division KSB1 bacterium]RQW05084.1 MAG: 3-deoxy-8-phosphooctulonate synthase [candidate division KSB1 bacterium]